MQSETQEPHTQHPVLLITAARHFQTNPKSQHSRRDTQWVRLSGCPSTDATTLPLGLMKFNPTNKPTNSLSCTESP